MSEFSNSREQKMQILKDFAIKVYNNDNVAQHFKQIRQIVDNQLSPIDVFELIDFLVKKNFPLPQTKTTVNKLLNLFYSAINKYPHEQPDNKSFLWYLYQNNLIIETKLRQIRPLLKPISKNIFDGNSLAEINSKFIDVQKFTEIYTIKENILFPAIEKYFDKFRCIQIMWSFHDDIRRNIKTVISLTKDIKSFDLQKFNRTSADIFFNMFAITFRDNKILFPVIQRVIPKQDFEQMLQSSADFEFPFLKPTIIKQQEQKQQNHKTIVNLPTGNLSVEQIALIFNHLPVDITYVDENNKVKYFSQPKSRIFPRSIGVIGRDVRNCHPPESVHIVEKIVEKFKTGEKDEAVFWLEMKGKFIVIKYFAVRDEQGKYRGVLEVSQEVNDIKQMQGQRRLLNWDD
jgi:DUF438 domain-containing protein